MKIREFLESTANSNFKGILVEMTLAPKDSLTGSKELLPYLEQIKMCDEFKNCNIFLMNSPSEVFRERTVFVLTRKLFGSEIFYGDLLLYQLKLGPTVFDPNNFESFNSVIIRAVFNN